MLYVLDGLLNYEILERWSIEKIRSCSWLSRENFIKEFEPFPSNLSNYSSSVNSIKPTKPSLEQRAHLRLEELGITSELFQITSENSDNNRDNINGTYRIIFHRLQKQSNPLERDDSYDKRIKEDLSSSWERSMSLNNDAGGRKTKPHVNQSPEQQTKVCIIL
jgi:hypothetical protein